MRWCRHCRSFNTGWPVRCRHCAAGLAGRLCPRNHVNPSDPQLAFCGDCGQPLSLAFGGGFSIQPYAVAGGIFVVSVGGALALLTVVSHLGLIAVLASLVVLASGGRLAYKLLPPSGQRSVTVASNVLWFITRILFRVGLRLVKVVANTTLKGRGGRGRGRR